MASDLDTARSSPRPTPRLTAGVVLSGRYRLTRHVATGGMGQVWAADDLVLHRRVAVKVLRDDLADQPTFLDRFEREARHAASVTHPHIAAVHDYVRDDTRAPHSFLVMELVQGESLSTLLRRTPTPRQGTTVRIITQSAEALSAAHRNGVVHRDVKPANIMLDGDGQVKLTDFGIAAPVDGASTAARTEVLGTPHYMSPEQVRGDTATPASDLYSLGVVAYEMLSGRRPFDGDSADEVMQAHLHRFPAPLPDDVPDHIRAVVLAALAKRAEDRPADAAAVARALRSVPITTDEPTQLLPRRTSHGSHATQVLPVDLLPTAVAEPGEATRHESPLVDARPRGGRTATRWIVAAVVVATGLSLSALAADDRPDVVPVEPTVPVTAAPTVVTTAATVPTDHTTVPGKKDKPGKGKGRSKGG